MIHRCCSCVFIPAFLVVLILPCSVARSAANHPEDVAGQSALDDSEPVPQIAYVSPTGSDANDGYTWAASKRTIQAGIAAAAPVAGEVWVAAGEYRENIVVPQQGFVYGGFGGNETSKSERNWRVNKSVISAVSSAAVVSTQLGGDPIVVDGFTIRGGGGVLLRDGSAHISNNTIIGGWGVDCEAGTHTILNNIIKGNVMGVRCWDGSTPVIANNVIAGNGGGVYCFESSPLIIGNTIVGNASAEFGFGAILCQEFSSPLIANNIIAFNSSGVDEWTESRYGDHGEPYLINNCIYNPDASGGYSGYLNYGPGNIEVDPKLAGLPYGDVHIQPDSPCIDAGDDTQIVSGWLDMDGEPRVRGEHVDIGADESDGATHSATVSVVRVSPTGNDGNDGSTWQLAKRTVQLGIYAASEAGGEVWVAAGEYDERVQLLPNCYLYGGFAGGETAKEERNWSSNRTILDGQRGGVVVSIDTGIMCSCIDGFTIRNGASVQIPGGESRGGGIYIGPASPTVSHNVIVGNSSGGGGIQCSGGGPVIAGNVIIGNGSQHGGGIFCGDSYLYWTGWGDPVGTPVVIGNTIAGNSGVGIDAKARMTIKNNIVAFNEAGITGGSGVISNNCVYNPGGVDYGPGITGEGDISVDPKLAAVEFGQVHLRPDSPCIDAVNDATDFPLPTDIDGQPRRTGEKVDIGADEYDGSNPTFTPSLVRVNEAGDDSNDGSSWSAAKRSVQAALNAASLTGGEVWVAEGVYTERVALPPYVYAYGGFAGTETARTERNSRENVTTLDGEAQGSVVTVLAGHHLSAIDGFTIRNGSGTSDWYPSYSRGGGIYCSTSSPLISNNVVTGNRLWANNGSQGGGVYCQYSSAVISNNTIAGNSISADTWGGNGAGVFCYQSSPRIVNNVITGNSAEVATYMYYGGGGVTLDECSGEVINNTIVGNDGAEGGGVACYDSTAPLANNIIAFNSSGIQVYALNVPVPIIANNCVYNPDGTDYTGVPGGDGDIIADPRLVSPSFGQVHIQPDSPCIDTGDNTLAQAGELDMDGEARVHGQKVDIGADESSGTTWSYTPTVVRVSPDGNDDFDGSSWDHPVKTIQRAIDLAAENGGGELWVKSATYKEHISLRVYVHVYGGFLGSEVELDQRNWENNLTVLDGNGSGPVVTAMGTGFGCSTIDGFTIQNGSADYGAGILCTSAPVISHNKITRNESTLYGGAGIFCRNCSPSILYNQITYNAGRATYADGGGISVDSGSPRIVGNTISDNTCGYYGGGISQFYGRSKILNNVIERNSAANAGGGMFVCNDDSGKILISGNVVRDNTAATGGGIDCYCPATVSDNLVTGNTAANGAGIWCYRTIVTNNTISDNHGDGICYESDGQRISNNIVAFNTRGMRCTGTAAYGMGPAVLRNNCVYNPGGTNYSGQTPGDGDISADPHFKDRQAKDYHLTLFSPCLNAGWTDAPGLPVLDIDGEARILFGGVDMGADECALKVGSIRDAKLFPDNSPAEIKGVNVSAAFPGVFYVQTDRREWGIRVETEGQSPAVGSKAHVEGRLATNSRGERCIVAASAAPVGSVVVEPMGLNSRVLGGGQCGYQGGTWRYKLVPDGSSWSDTWSPADGLSNIGLLVKTIGAVTVSGRGWFYVDDGAHIQDRSGFVGVYVEADGMQAPAAGAFVSVTGISSCEIYMGCLVNTLLPRNHSDIVVVREAGQSLTPSALVESPRRGKSQDH